MRDAFLRLWRTRGGGFYGLGYVIAFVALEVKAFVGSLESAADDVVGVVLQEVLQFVFRFAAQSMLNGFLALGWPIFVVAKLGGMGLAALALGWWLFDRYARPWVVVRLPEPAPPRAEDTASAGDPDTPAGASRRQPHDAAERGDADPEPVGSTDHHARTAAAPTEPDAQR